MIPTRTEVTHAGRSYSMRLMASFSWLMFLASCNCLGFRSTRGDTDTEPGEDQRYDEAETTDLPAEIHDVERDEGVDVGPSCDDFVDGDGDSIADRHEGNDDPDADGTPSSMDDDSDGDGFSDLQEAGDGDLCTRPVDTDSDTTPDFLDPDSDNDGLSDRDELEHGTDRLEEDSDGDGLTDLVEVEFGSDPLDDFDTPSSHGVLVFIEDFLEDPVPSRDTLVFGTGLQVADVYFVLDSSGSMAGEIENLRASLKDTIIPGLVSAIPDVQLGVMRFENCPGSTCANNLVNMQDVTSDVTSVEAALDSITEASLCEGEEPYALSLYVTATADISGTALPAASCTAGHFGYPCFRPGAIPIVVQIGDEPFCMSMMGIPTGGCVCNPSKDTDDAYTALNSINAKYIGVNSSGVTGTHGPRPDMEDVAYHTDSHDGSALFVFDVAEDGSGLDTSIVDAVGILSGSMPMDISLRVIDQVDGPTDTLDSSIFVQGVEPNVVGGVPDPLDPTRVCVGGLPIGDADTDGIADHFEAVAPGTIVCFDIVAAMNTTVERISGRHQIYSAVVHVVGDSVTVLEERDIYFFIPPG